MKRATQFIIMMFIIGSFVNIGLSQDTGNPFAGYWKTERGTIIKIEGDQGTCVYTPVISWKEFVGKVVIKNIRQEDDEWIADEFLLPGRKGLWAQIRWDYQDDMIVRQVTFQGKPVLSYYEKTDASWAVPARRADSSADGWTGNINFFLGAKVLDEDDWEPVDEQAEIGFLLDFKGKSWPVSIAVDLLGSYAEDDVYGVDIEGSTAELCFGVRKIWDSFEHVRPFIGGGIAFIWAEVEGERWGFSVSDDDTATGYWIGGGVYWTLAEHFNIGFDVRWSKAEVTLFDVDGEAGGSHVGFLLGYHW